MMKRKMRSLAIGLVCAGMALSVSGHAGLATQRAVQVASMSGLELPGLKKPITKRFVNTSLGDVLAWLSLEQFSFVADAGEFPGKSQVTLNFRNQPLGAVLDAIADAFNGRWEQRGEIFTLRPRDAFRGSLGVNESAAAIARGETRFDVMPPKPLTAPAAIARPGGRSFSPVLPQTGRANTNTFQFAPLPLLKGTPLAGGVTGRLQTNPSLFTPRVPSVFGRIDEPAPLARAWTVPPTVAAPKVWSAPEFELAIPMTGVREWSNQDPQSRAEAMRKAEDALRIAEQEIRKLHESGEWRKAMEKAMSEARSTQNSEAMQKALEEVRRNLQNLPRSEEWRKAFEEARAAMRKALQSGTVAKDGKERPMTAKEKEALEKAIQNMKTFEMPEIKMDFEKMFKEMPKLDEKLFIRPPLKLDENLMKEHKLQMEKLMKELPKVEGKAFVMPPMKLDESFMKDHKLQMEKLMKELPKVEGKAFVMPKLDHLPEGRAFVFDSKRMRIAELLDSLTAAQKEKQAKQGHLTVADLTPKQREMLGSIPTEGNWTFSYSIDGKKLTVKNK